VTEIYMQFPSTPETASRAQTQRRLSSCFCESELKPWRCYVSAGAEGSPGVQVCGCGGVNGVSGVRGAVQRPSPQGSPQVSKKHPTFSP